MQKVGSETMLSEIPAQVRIYRTTACEPSLKYLEKEREFGQRNWLARMIVELFGGARRWTFRSVLLPDRMVTWLPFAVKRGRQIVRDEGIDVIFATCPPHSVTLVGAFLKLLTGKPLILDFRDDWIDTPWHSSKPKIIRQIMRLIESFVVRNADRIVLVTEWSRNAFLRRYPTLSRKKFVFIPNGFDPEDLVVLNSLKVVPNKDKFTVLYAGSLNVSKSWGRNPVGLFQAVHKIIQQQPDLEEKLALVFTGDFPDEYQRLAEKMGLCGVINRLGNLPHDKVLRLIKSADLLVAVNYEGWSTLIPAKIYEYWAVGGPPILLLSCPGAASELVERYGLGLTVDPFDISGIIQAILMIYRQSKTATPLRLKTAGIEEYDRQTLTRKLAQVLSIVCS